MRPSNPRPCDPTTMTSTSSFSAIPQMVAPASPTSTRRTIEAVAGSTATVRSIAASASDWS